MIEDIITLAMVIGIAFWLLSMLAVFIRLVILIIQLVSRAFTQNDANKSMEHILDDDQIKR